MMNPMIVQESFRAGLHTDDLSTSYFTQKNYAISLPEIYKNGEYFQQ